MDSVTDLAARMRAHLPGQITWPEPKLRLRCADCAHFIHGGGAHGKGRCDLVELHHKAKGVAFIGEAAIACPQIRRR
jgi:hypothetical protein